MWSYRSPLHREQWLDSLESGTGVFASRPQYGALSRQLAGALLAVVAVVGRVSRPPAECALSLNGYCASDLDHSCRALRVAPHSRGVPRASRGDAGGI